MSTYQFKGSLRAYLCDECFQRLGGVTVRLYRHRQGQDVPALVAAAPKTTFNVLSEAEVAKKADFLIAETRTDAGGAFRFQLNDDKDGYDGEAFEVDVRLTTVPGAEKKAKGKPVQFTITSLQPDWKPQGEVLAAPAWDYFVPARFWCHLLERFGLWAICGRVVTCQGRQPLPGARVEAFDADIVQHDPLGADTTDFNGHFRIYYTTADFRRTPFPFIQEEIVSGPDLFFKVEFGGSTIIDEPHATGRHPGRANVGRCACVELCSDEVVPPDAVDIPHWERVEVFEVDTDFSAEGYAGAGSLVMSDGITLHGNMPLKNVVNNKALKYRFLVGPWAWPGAEDPAVMPSVPPADAALTPVTSINPSKVGYLYYTDANGDPRSAPVVVTTSDLDGDGCIQLLGHTVTVDMHDGTTANVAVTQHNFVGAYLLMNMNSLAVTPPPYDVVQDLGKPAAGNPVPAAQRAPIRRFKLRFQVFDFDQAVNNTTNNKTLNALVIDNSPARYALHLAQLEANLCNPVTNQVHIRYTIDHPHLSFFNVKISSNAGVVHNAPPLPNGSFGGNFFFRGGQSGPAGFAVNVAGDPKCAYAVTLSWQTRHYHGGRGGARSVQLLYCK